MEEYYVSKYGKIIHPIAFFALCFFTLGLYDKWWQYKQWKFFNERDDLEIYPVVRAIFSIFFIHSLLEHIDFTAKENDQKEVNASTNATFYIVLSILVNLISRLDDKYLIFAFLIPYYAFLIPSVKQMNSLWENQNYLIVQKHLTPGSVITLIIGIILTSLIFFGILIGDQLPQ